MENDPTAFEDQTWVCMGYYVQSDHTLGIKWGVVNDGAILKNCYYDANVFKDAFVGQIISIQANSLDTCRSKTAKHLGRWQDHTLVAEWEFSSAVAKAELRLYKQSRFDKRSSILVELLAPLHQQYIVATPTERRVMEILVLEYMRNGRIKD